MTDSELQDELNSASDASEFADPWQGVGVRQRGDKDIDDSMDTDNEPPLASLNPDDAGADADLPRPSRAEKQRIRRRTTVSAAVPGVLLIVIGAVRLLRPEIMNPPIFAGALAGTVLLGILLRFVFNARRERGLLFLCLTVIFVAGIVALDMARYIDLSQMWPLFIVAPGLAIFITFIFERSHERALLLPAFMLMVAGVALLPFTMGYFDSSLLDNVAIYWPVLLIFVVVALLPRAIRDRAE